MTINRGSSMGSAIAGLAFLFIIGGGLLYFQDVETFRLQRQVSSSFLKLGGLLNLESLQSDSLSENLASIVKRVRLDDGSIVYYDEHNKNPFPEWLPDHRYVVNKEREQAPDGVLISAPFFYWFDHDVEVVLYWDGKTEVRARH